MVPVSFGTRAVLYSCSQRTAFHVHKSQLLRAETGESRMIGVAATANSNVDGTLVDGIKDMQVEDSASSTRDRKRKAVAAVPNEEEPKTCGAAISKGLSFFDSGDYNTAIDYFTMALELPGNGALRLAGSVKEYACPSEGEEQAALYNMACCYSKLGEIESGLTVLQGLLENGFEDYDTLRGDDDLAGLRRSPDFEKVIAEFDSLPARLLGRKKRKTERKKGWLARW